jgi:prefoldin alpha subunit
MADLPEAKKKELQQHYLALQLYDAQIKQVQKQVQAVEAQLMEVDQVQLSLDEFGRTKPGSEALVPVSNGIFARAELRDTAKLLVNVGSGAVAEKTVAEAKELLKGQAAELRKTEQELLQAIERLAGEAEKAERAVNAIMTGA